MESFILSELVTAEAAPQDAAPLDPRIARSKAAILKATAQMLIDVGASAITIEGISERSGVAKTTIYRHWRSRSQLVFDAFAGLLLAQPPRPEPGPVRERLVTIMIGLVWGLTKSRWAPAVTTLLDAADRDPELARLVHDFLEARMEPYREVLREAIARGELRPDIDLDVAVSTLSGPVFYRRLVSRETIDAPYVEKVVDQFLAAWRTSPTTK
jgi:AcrR family transcriptional regulator